jgi:ferredoxin/flavodoxin---NADP+ reductase
MPKPVAYNAVIVEREDLSPTLAIFRIRPDEVPSPQEPWFEPGQYVVLGLNAGDREDGESILRAYSIASEPEERRWLEFYIRYAGSPETPMPFTHMLWRKRPGDRVHVGPRFVGRFTLGHTVGPEDPRLKVFVAAGTGLAPFVSIIRSHARKAPADQLTRFAVLHGASHPHELGYRDDLERVMNRIAPRYFPTVSRPGQAGTWQGDTGRVETFFDGEKLDALERRLGLAEDGLNPERAVIYVCGFRGTIAATIVRLIQRGFVPDDRRMRRLLEVAEETPASLFFEQYDTEPILDPTDETLMAKLREAFQKAAG